MIHRFKQSKRKLRRFSQNSGTPDEYDLGAFNNQYKSENPNRPISQEEQENARGYIEMEVNHFADISFLQIINLIKSKGQGFNYSSEIIKKESSKMITHIFVMYKYFCREDIHAKNVSTLQNDIIGIFQTYWSNIKNTGSQQDPASIMSSKQTFIDEIMRLFIPTFQLAFNRSHEYSHVHNLVNFDTKLFQICHFFTNNITNIILENRTKKDSEISQAQIMFKDMVHALTLKYKYTNAMHLDDNILARDLMQSAHDYTTNIEKEINKGNYKVSRMQPLFDSYKTAIELTKQVMMNDIPKASK